MKGFAMAIVCILLIWAVVDGQELFRPANVARKVVKPIVRPIIDEIKDRVIDPVTKKEVSGPSVIVVGRSWCGPCKQLMSEEMPKARKDGYAVHYDDKLPAASFPTVRIWDGRKWSTRVGFFRWVKP
jgi:thiol-disulfide isomerase/thioredoxin